jgi:hypothetical protein
MRSGLRMSESRCESGWECVERRRWAVEVERTGGVEMHRERESDDGNGCCCLTSWVSLVSAALTEGRLREWLPSSLLALRRLLRCFIVDRCCCGSGKPYLEAPCMCCVVEQRRS